MRHPCSSSPGNGFWLVPHGRKQQQHLQTRHQEENQPQQDRQVFQGMKVDTHVRYIYKENNENRVFYYYIDELFGEHSIRTQMWCLSVRPQICYARLFKTQRAAGYPQVRDDEDMTIK